MFSRIIKDPLTHFLIISFIIFFFYEITNSEQPESHVVTVSEGRIEQLKNDIVNTKNRQPVQQELDIAIQSYALNEIYLREARALGLNQGDTVINRRLRQKMEYLLGEMAEVVIPTDKQLESYYQTNIDKYQTEISYTFKQILISTDDNEQVINLKLEQQQELINKGQDPVGIASLLPGRLEDSSVTLITREFGSEFSKSLGELPINKWTGPINSSIGKHFVFIEKLTPKQAKPLSLVKNIVKDDWQYDNAQNFKKSYESELVTRYIIEVEYPEKLIEKGEVN